MSNGVDAVHCMRTRTSPAPGATVGTCLMASRARGAGVTTAWWVAMACGCRIKALEEGTRLEVLRVMNAKGDAI